MSARAARELASMAGRAGRVGVLMGGASAEREISLRSGAAVLAALVSAGVNAEGVDWDGKLDSVRDWRAFDRYFIALHGRGGEDGQIQAVLELMGIPFTGTRMLGCALAMDKVRTKLVWAGAGLPTPPFEVLGKDPSAAEVIGRLGLPLMIKPAREGSSLGVSRVASEADFDAAARLARSFDDIVIAERYVEGGEYTLSIVSDTAFPLIKLETPREFYDYDAKYVTDDTEYICPCGLDDAAERQAAELGLRAFEVINAHGWGRVDFMRDDQGRNWLIELNTVPGMTDHSLVPMAARHAGMSFEELVLSILASSF